MTRALLVAAALFGCGAFAGVATGQNGTSDARAEGKAFGSGVLGRAQTAAKIAPTAESVPGYQGTPSEAALAQDPDAIVARGASAAASNDGYQAVRSSLDRRPRVAVADIEAAIARGQAIAADPNAYVSGMSVGGGQGTCRELPPSSAASATYAATCNVGMAIHERAERCAVSLTAKVNESVAYRYYVENPYHTGLSPDVAEFGAALASGVCTMEGPVDACAVTRAYGLTPTSRCGRFHNAIVRCSSELPGLSGNMVPATGRSWFERAATRTISMNRDESACAPIAADTACVQQAETCTSSDPATRDIDGVSTAEPCWAWERSYRCTRVSPAQDCDALAGKPACRLDREECLTDERPCPTIERIYRCPVPDGPQPTPQFVCDGDIYCINGECETIEREPNQEFKDAAVALHAASQAGRELDPANLTLFNGERQTCHSAVFGLLNCCAGKAFPLIPGAQLLVTMGCAREEVLLHQRDAQGLCHYVGSYCSDNVLGICVTKRKAYCCFESKLSRILQEQGRPQINKPWGKPKSETCQGFTVDEFARLDLSRMDFSEVYAEFQDAAKLPEELSTVSAMQRKISDYYALNGGRR